MQTETNFNINHLILSLIEVNQKIIKNYIKNYSGYHHDMRDIAQTYVTMTTKMLVHPSDSFKIYNLTLNYLESQQEIIKNFITNKKMDDYEKTEAGLHKQDKRFLNPYWNTVPYFNLIKNNYLLFSKLCKQIVTSIEIDDKIKKKINFYTDQYINAIAPSNFLLTNPEAINIAIQTNGKSLINGLNNLLQDLEKGHISQTDEAAFIVGKNIAITPGTVIFENELMQIIQYNATTKKTFQIPLLIIPPWINKYYILDLQQKNSFVKFLIDKGISVFMVSWRNPQPGTNSLTFDDYVEKGALKSIEVVKSITNSKKINTLGYCLGGTLLSIACTILVTNEKEHPINSATFLAAMIDFTDIGPMGDVIDGALIRKLERGELLHAGILNGNDMETAFNLIRANDLIWNYVVNNYLKGQKPAAFDVLNWTNDNTNLPAKMYLFYMKHIIFENKLSRKNALKICNTPIDIAKINFPVIVIALKEDTISPAITLFTTTELVTGPVEYILGGSGHVMGVVNPPSKNKYGYYLNGKLNRGFEEWKKTAAYFEGSWWTPFIERLINHSGSQINAPLKAGNNMYKPIQPAPGCYVQEKC